MQVKAVVVAVAALALMLVATPVAEAKSPHGVKRIAKKIKCEVYGPMSFDDGPKGRGVICWQHDRPVERITDANKTFVMRYADADEAKAYWKDFLGGEGCVAMKGNIVVIPGDTIWYDCDLARKAAKRIDGELVR